VEKQQVLHILSVCVCSLMYSACNAHAPYCYLWPVRLYDIFPHYLVYGTIFGGGGGVTEHKICVLISSTPSSETFLILRRTEHDMIIVVSGFHVKYPSFLFDFNEI